MTSSVGPSINGGSADPAINPDTGKPWNDTSSSSTPAASTTPAVTTSNFTNPVGDQSGNWLAGMQGLLGVTTQAAPQIGQTQLATPATYGGANVGQTALSGQTQLNGGQYNSTYNQEQGLANQYAQQASGQGPSLAQFQAQQSAGQNVQSQMAALASQRGSSNPALAQYQAQMAGATANQQAAQQAVAGRIQEQLQGQQGLASTLGNMNTQAQQFAGTNAQLGQQNQQFNAGAQNAQQLAQAQLYQQAGLANQSAQNTSMLQQGNMNQNANLANLQATQNQNQLNDQQYNQYMNYLQSMNQQQFAANQNQAQITANGANLQTQINATNDLQNAQQIWQTARGVGSSAGYYVTPVTSDASNTTSDIRSKTNISNATNHMDKILSILSKF